MNTAFTICSTNYLSQALSLKTSIMQTNQEDSYYSFLRIKNRPFQRIKPSFKLTRLDLPQGISSIFFHVTLNQIIFKSVFVKNFSQSILDIDSPKIEINTNFLKVEGVKHNVELIKKKWLLELNELLV